MANTNNFGEASPYSVAMRYSAMLRYMSDAFYEHITDHLQSKNHIVTDSEAGMTELVHTPFRVTDVRYNETAEKIRKNRKTGEIVKVESYSEETMPTSCVIAGLEEHVYARKEGEKEHAFTQVLSCLEPHRRFYRM